MRDKGVDILLRLLWVESLNTPSLLRCTLLSPVSILRLFISNNHEVVVPLPKYTDALLTVRGIDKPWVFNWSVGTTLESSLGTRGVFYNCEKRIELTVET